MRAFVHDHLTVDAVFEGADVGDDAHQPVALGQAGEDPDGLFQRFVVEGAEALVEEEGVQPDAAGRALDFVRKAQRQRQRGLEALAAGKGLHTAAGAVVVVDDAKVQAGLAALVLGTDALQLVLPGGHLHQTGVGVAQDAVEIVHLDVGFQLDLLLAGQGAARRGGQRADPLPARFQRVPGRGGGGIFRRRAVGQQLGRQRLFPARAGLLAGSGCSAGLPGRKASSGWAGPAVSAVACWVCRASTAALAAA